MPRLWSMEEIGERWTLRAEDLAWLSGRRGYNPEKAASFFAPY
jgi:hypothetical protein